jgi:hypothetical protein
MAIDHHSDGTMFIVTPDKDQRAVEDRIGELRRCDQQARV